MDLSKLNALVAKEIMGWEYRQESPDPKKVYCLSNGNDKGWWKDPKIGYWYCEACGCAPPNYAEDIEFALQVAEKENISIVSTEDGWYVMSTVDLSHHRDDSWIVVDNVSKIPCAICDVALTKEGIIK